MEENRSKLEAPLIKFDERSHATEGLVTQGGCWGGEIIEEAKRQLGLAVPLVAVSILQYCLQIISIMFVGHLGELPLSSASMATSFASVTGFSVLLGMGSALETLCGQAYGAKQYHMLGIYTQRGMVVLFLLSIFLAVIWFYTDSILIVFGQDKEISVEAGKFNRWMIPAIFPYALLQCVNRFLQTQNIVFPMMMTSGITALSHVFTCWLLVVKTGLGSRGAALANAISYWVNVFLLVVYIKFSSAFSNTWTGFSSEPLQDILGFLKLSVPSAIMICFEYWSFEMVVLLSGRLPNPKLETSVLSISLNTCWMVYMISVGLGAAIRSGCSTVKIVSFSDIPPDVNIRKLQDLKKTGNPEGARLALCVVIAIAITEGAVVGTTTILVRHVWGKMYSNEEEVVRYVATMLPLLALSDFLDGFQCVLSGAARGCGWQNLCAFINLGAYYMIGIPSAILFAFAFHFGGMGLWMGIICGLTVQVIALVAINLRTDWTTEARKAANRILS